MPVFTNEVDVLNTPLPVDTTGQTIAVTGTVTTTPSGTQNVNVTNSPLAVTGLLTDAQLRATPVPISGTVSVGAAASTATITQVSVSPTVATLSASNAAKTGVVVFNESGTLFVKLGSGASSNSYSYRLTANSGVEINGYTGIITGTKVSGTSFALVTEIGI